jgi:hypothetical protein
MSGEGGFHMRLHEGDLRDRNVDHSALTSYIWFPFFNGQGCLSRRKDDRLKYISGMLSALDQNLETRIVHSDYPTLVGAPVQNSPFSIYAPPPGPLEASSVGIFVRLWSCNRLDCPGGVPQQRTPKTTSTAAEVLEQRSTPKSQFCGSQLNHCEAYQKLLNFVIFCISSR